MSSTSEDDPRPEQWKTSQEGTVTSHWAHLPPLVLTEIFGMLNKEDRRNASGVCRSWRKIYFQPRLWRSFKFSIQPNEFEKASFLTNIFGLTVKYTRIVLKSISGEYLKGLIKLLQTLAINNNLKYLVIQYSPADFELPNFVIRDEDRYDDLTEVMNLLKICLPRLKIFTADCVAALSFCVGSILENLNPLLVTRLGLTSMTGCSGTHSLDPALLKRLTRLEVLYIDQQVTTDELLDVVESCTGFKKLVVYHRTRLPNHLDPPRSFASLHQRPSRRFVQLFRSRSVLYNIRLGNLGQEIVVTRIVMF